MTSPCLPPWDQPSFSKEQVSRARILATLAGLVGAMLILAPWTDDFTLASLLPVAAALFWAGYSLAGALSGGQRVVPHRRLPARLQHPVQRHCWRS